MNILGILQRINAECGVEIWQTPEKAIGAYRDIAPKEKAVAKLLKDLCDSGACQILMATISENPDSHVLAYHKAISVMQTNSLYPREVIECLCYDFCVAAGITLPGIIHRSESSIDYNHPHVEKSNQVSSTTAVGFESQGKSSGTSSQATCSGQNGYAVSQTSDTLNTAISTSTPKPKPNPNRFIRVISVLIVSVILIGGTYYFISRSNTLKPVESEANISSQKTVGDITEMQFQKSDLNSYSKVADFYASLYALCDNAGTLVFNSVNLDSDGSDYVFLKLQKGFDGSVMFYGKIIDGKWTLEGFDAYVFDPSNSDAEEISRFFAASLFAFDSVDDYHKAEEIISDYLLAWDLESEQYLETITISGKQFELVHTFAEGSMYLSIKEI